MSQRNIRVNELIKREVSDILHTRYRSESVRITITSVDVAPDHRAARVYFSVIGGEGEKEATQAWLDGLAREIRHQVGRRIILKYLPHLSFELDTSIERGIYLNELLDEIDDEQ